MVAANKWLNVITDVQMLRALRLIMPNIELSSNYFADFNCNRI